MYATGIVYICIFIGIDSDKANHLLQAKDILEGNFFFRDWNLTGVTFLTTDLLFYEIAYLIFGISYKAICVSGGLMISTALFVSYFLSYVGTTNNNKLLKSVLWILLLAIPCEGLVQSFRVHTGAIIICFISFLLYYLITEKEDDYLLYIVLMGVALFMGMFGDLLTLIEGIIPVLVLGMLTILRKKALKKKDYLVIIVPILSMIIAIVFKKIYFFIGKANPNSYIGNRLFTPVNEWGNKVLSFISDLMILSMADFTSNRIADFWSLIKVFYFLLMVIGIVFIVIIVVKLIKKESCDSISGLLAISCIISFIAYLLTDLAYKRYITIIPIALIIIVIRNIEWLYSNIYRKKMAELFIIVAACFGFLGKVRELKAYRYPESNLINYELISFLENHNLTNGYASFWNSSNITVLSNERVKIRHIIKQYKTYQMHNWFNKNSWYKESCNFVLINSNSENDVFGVNEIDITYFFGEPKEKYEISEYKVLVYDKDLSKSLGKKINAIDDGIVFASEMYTTNGTETKDNCVILQKGSILYGPYDNISKGDYTITFEGSNLENATYDIFSNKNQNNNAFIYKAVYRSNNKIVVSLTLYEMIEDIEFRLFNMSEQEIVFKDILVKKDLTKRQRNNTS